VLTRAVQQREYDSYGVIFAVSHRNSICTSP
jgi:hypothetical protein